MSVSRVPVLRDKFLKCVLNSRLRGMGVGPQRDDCVPVTYDEVLAALNEMDGARR